MLASLALLESMFTFFASEPFPAEELTSALFWTRAVATLLLFFRRNPIIVNVDGKANESNIEIP